MEQEIKDFIDLNKRLEDLGITLKEGLYILPENIETAENKNEFVFTETTTDIKKYLTQNDVNISVIQEGSLTIRQRKSVDFYAPLLFISFSVLSENSTLITVGINVLSNYITDYFKGTFGSKNVKLEVIVETKAKKEYKSINYEGNIEGLKELTKIIKSLNDN